MDYRKSYLFSRFGVIPNKHDFIKEPVVYHGTYDNPANLRDFMDKEEEHFKFVSFVDAFYNPKQKELKWES
jgi:hypothetical protein